MPQPTSRSRIFLSRWARSLKRAVPCPQRRRDRRLVLVHTSLCPSSSLKATQSLVRPDARAFTTRETRSLFLRPINTSLPRPLRLDRLPGTALALPSDQRRRVTRRRTCQALERTLFPRWLATSRPQRVCIRNLVPPSRDRVRTTSQALALMRVRSRRRRSQIPHGESAPQRGTMN